MKKSKFLSLVMALAMVLSMSAIPSFADSTISTAGGTGTSDVVLTVAAPTFSVTVPTSLPISVAADGTVTTSDAAVITNNSYGAVKVTNLAIAHSGDYVICNYTDDFTSKAVGSKNIGMQIGNNGDATLESTTGADAITFQQSNWGQIAGKLPTGDAPTLSVDYNAKTSAFAAAVDGATVATVTFTVGWDAV